MAAKRPPMPRPPSPDQPPVHAERVRGRGAKSNLTGRFENQLREDFDDGWDRLPELPPFKTEVREEVARQIISTNDSPDIFFDQSINPYRGCEHGCIYCYARPTHCYLGLSAGLDFESVLTAKPNAATLLETELARPGYRVKPIMLGANTDPYQPIEKTYQITRQLLEIADRTSHPVGIVTKSALILRDLDLLASLANRGLVKVTLSVTSLDHLLSRRMEPRASTPGRRIDAMARLAEAGVPVGVLVAPVIPAINNAEIEAILERCAEAGASEAGYVLLRLPLEIAELFQEWLAAEFPGRAKRAMSLLRSARGGAEYVPKFGERHTGTGVYADLVAQRFGVAVRRLKLDERGLELRCDLFKPPAQGAVQLDLFDFR